jgi:malate synthase
VIQATVAVEPAFQEILTPEALTFVTELQRRFGARRAELLAARKERQKRLDAGERPGFLPETAHIRAGDWKIKGTPADLQDRRVEITGPVDRKMIINALNSGARVFMADFEDSNCPTWENNLNGQINLRDANRRTISFVSEVGKEYRLNPQVATLIVRPRGWHLDEKHLTLDGQPVSGSLVDFGLYFFHNTRTLLLNGTGPYFYLPKLENHLEARLWNDVFVFAQEYLSLPVGTIKATVLIEVITAAFEMDEILYELRDHIVGLNCGRWDYIFSIIKKFARQPSFVMPDRSQVTMTVPNMRAYSLLLIQTCHKRGAHAMGGMAAQIPIKNDPVANEAALAKVRADKEREATDGHDGTWVAHPGLVQIALDVFNAIMPTPNQIHNLRTDVNVSAEDLLAVPSGSITFEGFKNNLDVAIQYMEAWLGGNGCVPIYNLMEDAATAEISRSQIWQWVVNGARLADGRLIDADLVRQTVPQVLDFIKAGVGDDRFAAGNYTRAAELVVDLSLRPDFVEFLTLPAYEQIA